MRDEIWYREELLALRGLVEAQIQRTNPLEVMQMIGLGGMHLKLTKAIETAPSARTPEAAA